MEVAGIEPARARGSIPANKRDSTDPTEALIKILSEISGTDRQMMTRIFQRWGDFSDDLRQAVLRISQISKYLVELFSDSLR